MKKVLGICMAILLAVAVIPSAALPVLAADNDVITFTDPNFEAAVLENMIASGLPLATPTQITEGEAKQLISLDVSGKGITSLDGLAYFTGLKHLLCSDNQLTSLPTLPIALLELRCSGNQLTSLPELPTTLTYLSCFGNQLTSLPTLPPTLTDLACYNNQLTTLNLTGLTKLTYLYCSRNLFPSKAAIIGLNEAQLVSGFKFEPQNIDNTSNTDNTDNTSNTDNTGSTSATATAARASSGGSSSSKATGPQGFEKRRVNSGDITVEGNRITVQGQTRLGFLSAYHQGNRIEGVKTYDGSCIVVLPDRFLDFDGTRTVRLEFTGAYAEVEISGGAYTPPNPVGTADSPTENSDAPGNANSNPSTGR